jgi:predicted nuclease with TOPRIM domain
LEEKVEAKVDERIQSLQKVMTNLSTENMEFKSRVVKTELENTELKGKINGFSSDLENVKTRLGFFEEFIELSDVVKTENGWRKIQEFFARLRENVTTWLLFLFFVRIGLAS